MTYLLSRKPTTERRATDFTKTLPLGQQRVRYAHNDVPQYILAIYERVNTPVNSQ